MSIQSELLSVSCDDVELKHQLMFDANRETYKGAVLVAHAWGGQSAFELEKATTLAELGYVSIALDVYGDAKTGNNKQENAALMQPLAENRGLLQERLLTSLSAIGSHARVDAKNMVAIGYCFGGLSVLDLARAGGDLKGVVSFHGILAAPDNLKAAAMTPKVLVCHGYDDPMVLPDVVQAFADEMTNANADWQIHMYGGAMHGFTHPEANDLELGVMYNADANHRSWTALHNFLSEVLDA